MGLGSQGRMTRRENLISLNMMKKMIMLIIRTLNLITFRNKLILMPNFSFKIMNIKLLKGQNHYRTTSCDHSVYFMIIFVQNPQHKLQILNCDFPSARAICNSCFMFSYCSVPKIISIHCFCKYQCNNLLPVFLAVP